MKPEEFAAVLEWLRNAFVDVCNGYDKAVAMGAEACDEYIRERT